MPVDQSRPHSTLALNTKVEEDFVSPLTAVRGSLEILRDFPDLAVDERQRFVEAALRGCARLEKGIEELASTVYAAGEQTHSPTPEAGARQDRVHEYADHVRFLDDIGTVEIELGAFTFSSSKIVNDFYDVVEKLVEATGRDWYFLVNYGGCSVWPEAWVAFAHRGKKVNVEYSLGTVRYAASEVSRDQGQTESQSESSDPDFLESREAALARIEEIRSAKPE